MEQQNAELKGAQLEATGKFGFMLCVHTTGQSSWLELQFNGQKMD
jgi:hypothetical protein